MVFDVMPYKETGTHILKSPDEASQLLDDHIVMTQSMSFSPFKKQFEERISTWENKLRLTQVHCPRVSVDLLAWWSSNTWVYLGNFLPFWCLPSN